MLIEHKADLEAITRGLMQHEELDRKQITELIGESVHAGRLGCWSNNRPRKQKKPVAKAKNEADAKSDSDAETKPISDGDAKSDSDKS